jgi:hypothetical protein
VSPIVRATLVARLGVVGVQDLDDLYYFIQVVEHGGFAAGAHALGVPKSKLGRRVTALEQRLGVSLPQRSTRVFRSTASDANTSVTAR